MGILVVFGQPLFFNIRGARQLGPSLGSRTATGYIDVESVQWSIDKVNMLSLRALAAQFSAVRFNRMIYISSSAIE